MPVETPKERPILFSAPMVRAILDGRKAMTRRIVNPQPVFEGVRSYGDSWAWKRSDEDWFSGVTTEQLTGKFGLLYGNRCPHGGPGDRLWVRESFSYDSLAVDKDGTLHPWYWADGNPVAGDFTRPKPSIHMPRWASRISLRITDVRVERLLVITHEDSRAEGITDPRPERCRHLDSVHFACCAEYPHTDYRARFGDLWDSINGDRPGCAWKDNPWVWVVSFQRVQC